MGVEPPRRDSAVSMAMLRFWARVVRVSIAPVERKCSIEPGELWGVAR